jgi:drug/metabolite transporter (DMT)-like permease
MTEPGRTPTQASILNTQSTAHHQGTARLGLGLAVLSAISYGANIVGARIVAEFGMSGAIVVAWRTLLMLAGLALLALVLRAPLGVTSAFRRPMALLGITSAVIGTAYLSSVAFLPISVAVVIFYTFPILVVLAEPFVTGGRFGVARLALAAIAFAGVAMVVGPDAGNLDWRGIALAGTASLGAAVQFFAARRCADVPAIAKLFWVNIIVAPVVLVIVHLTGGFAPVSAIGAAPIAFIVAVGGFFIGIVLQFAALARVSASAAALAFCLEPVAAAGFAALILGERMAGLQYLGVALVLGAVAANVVRESRGGS